MKRKMVFFRWRFLPWIF